MTREGPAEENRVIGDWREYWEIPPGHGKGYFWRRSDGLRFGGRAAGEYYKPGSSYEPVRNRSSWGMRDSTLEGEREVGYSSPDNVLVFDVIGAERERAKKEFLPDHIRIMRNGVEIEHLTSLNGAPVFEANISDIVKYCDEKWPLRVFKAR